MSSDESTSEGNTNINISKKTVKTILNVLSWLVFYIYNLLIYNSIILISNTFF